MTTKLPIDDATRAAKNEFRSLSADSAGNEVLVGLTVEQSLYVLQYDKDWLERKPRKSADERDKQRVLREKHEIARLQAVGAEIQLRNERPHRH